MISTTQQSVNQKKFSDNFDDIFGHKKPSGGSFTQGADGKLVPRGTIKTHTGAGTAKTNTEFQEFVSPIDQRVISDRGQLARHNKEHGVTDSRDYSGGFIEKRAEKRIKDGQDHLKKTRTEDIHRAISLHTPTT